MSCARCRCRSIVELARHLDDGEPPQPAGHAPLDFVTLAVAEQCRTERREHGNAPRADIGFRRQHQRVLILASGREIAHAHARLHGDHVGRYFFGEAHDRTLELGLELVQVGLVMRGLVPGAQQCAQAVGVRFAHEDRGLSHDVLQWIEAPFS